MFSIEVIEFIAFLYLRSLSFQTSLGIMRARYDKKVLSKKTIIYHLEKLVDLLPDQLEVTEILKPKRSGYYALDGTWLKHQGKDIVLLIIFDIVTLDVINWVVAKDETTEDYLKLIKPIKNEIKNVTCFLCDGELSILKALKKEFPGIPIQTCIFHKFSRIGQIIPFVRIKTEIDKKIKNLVMKVLFATSRENSCLALEELKIFAKENKGYKKLQKVIGSLRRGFPLLLTHFDYPEISPYNNTLEGFNHVFKRKTKLMKGFKKEVDIDRWIKLMILDWRFHILESSMFKERRGKSPLKLAGCKLPKYYNWIKTAREIRKVAT